MRIIMKTKHTSIRIFTVLTAITVSVLFVSCKKTRISEEDAINVGASFFYTRALVTDLASLQSQSTVNGMGVFGYKQAKAGNGPIGTLPGDFTGTVTENIFNNVNVKYSNPNWTYTNTKYWDRNCYYRFVAYWPYAASGVTVSNHVLTIAGVNNWQAVDGNEKDWLTAASMGGANGYYLASQSGTVNFDFTHLLAKINIRAYYIGDQSTDVTVNNLKIGSETATKKVPTTAGTVNFTRDYSAATNEPAQSAATLGGQHDLIKSTFSNYQNGGIKLPKTAFCSDDSDPTSKVFPGWPLPDTLPEHEDGDYYDVCSWLVVEFTNAAIPLTATYHIGTTEKTSETPVEITGLTSIEAGNEYTITLKFDTNSAGIECQSVFVKNWEAGPEQSKDVYNW